MSGKYHQYSHISCNSRFRQCSTTGTILTKPIITTLHNVLINYLGIKGHVKISFKSRFCHGYTIIVEKSAPVSHWSLQSCDLRESHYGGTASRGGSPVLGQLLYWDNAIFHISQRLNSFSGNKKSPVYR